MKLVLKTKDRMVTVFWVKYDKRKNRVLGWYGGDWVNHHLGLAGEVHFDYPEDGNFHYSYVSPGGALEEYIHIYWDKVEIKTEVEGSGLEKMEKTREEFQNNALAHLVPRVRSKPLAEVSHHQFVLVGFNIFDGNFARSESEILITQDQIKDGDMLIDVSNFNNRGLNATAILRDPNKIYSIHPNLQSFVSSQKVSDNLVLDLVCNII